ncbi:MAG: DUF5055 domain-containing protein [Lachnospiraceae bacterium]|nr:DUF5055 domain-containing protein [Lachnospiraceae bacterium]
MEQIKPIIIRDNDTETEYTLEFNRESVRFAESKGFVFEDLANYPMTKIPELFFYAFRMHHKNVARNQTDAILDKMNGIPAGLLERLTELYAVPFETLNIVEEGEERKNSPIAIDF